MHENAYLLLDAMKHYLQCRICFEKETHHKGYALDQLELQDIPQENFLYERQQHNLLIS